MFNFMNEQQKESTTRKINLLWPRRSHALVFLWFTVCSNNLSVNDICSMLLITEIMLIVLFCKERKGVWGGSTRQIIESSQTELKFNGFHCFVLPVVCGANEEKPQNLESDLMLRGDVLASDCFYGTLTELIVFLCLTSVEIQMLLVFFQVIMYFNIFISSSFSCTHAGRSHTFS